MLKNNKMGVCNNTSINLMNKEAKNMYNIISSKLSSNDKSNIKTPINTSKSNQKEKKTKIYNKTELNKTNKIPTIKRTPKNIKVNFSSEKSQILPKKSNSRNVSFLKEETQSKNKLNKKIPIYTKDLSSKKNIHENVSFVKQNKMINNTEWSKKRKKGIKLNENNCSLSPKKKINEHLFNNWSFNDLSFNNLNSVSVNNYTGLKNVNIIKTKKVCFNKNNDSQINRNNKKNISNIKKIKPNIESNLLINCFSGTNKNKSIIASNYSSYNKNGISLKKKFFNLNNKYSVYNNYSLYIIDDENMDDNFIHKKYSDENDFINIINQKNTNETKIITDLLNLKQRNWYDELINISINIYRAKNKINKYFNQIIEKYILIYEHFNWMIYSLSTYFKNIFFDNEKNMASFNSNNSGFGLDNKIENWLNGFKWKGLYVKVIPYEKSKLLINEIKALNYYFFDYLQLIDNSQYIKKKEYSKKNRLLNEIIFPLIGYCKISNLILYASALIIPDKKNINYEKKVVNTYITTIELIEQSNKLLNYYSNVDASIGSICSFETNVSYNDNNNSNILNINKIKKTKIYMTLLHKKNSNNEFGELDLESSLGHIFYVKNLLESKLFKEINNYNLIKIKEGKYIIFNLAKYIPKLFKRSP